jgi:hypothetical protein
MFKQRSQSPEARSEDPKVTRTTTVALAVGFLTAAIEANPSGEAFVMSAAPTTLDVTPLFIAPVYQQGATQESLIEQARISTERAFNAHGQYSYPAEAVTEDFIDAQNMLHRSESDATVIPFPQQLEEHNPILRKSA